MAFQLTVADVKAKYKEQVLIRLTDDSKMGQINDDIISIAIDDAEVSLSSVIEIDEAIYSEKKLKKWWRDLTYYELFKRVEGERIVKDKYDEVMEEIKAFKENISEKSGSDYPNGYIITASSEILPEADILRWK